MNGKLITGRLTVPEFSRGSLATSLGSTHSYSAARLGLTCSPNAQGDVRDQSSRVSVTKPPAPQMLRVVSSSNPQTTSEVGSLTLALKSGDCTKTTFKLPRELHRQLRDRAASEQCYQYLLISTAISEYLMRHGRDDAATRDAQSDGVHHHAPPIEMSTWRKFLMILFVPFMAARLSWMILRRHPEYRRHV